MILSFIFIDISTVELEMNRSLGIQCALYLRLGSKQTYEISSHQACFHRKQQTKTVLVNVKISTSVLCFHGFSQKHKTAVLIWQILVKTVKTHKGENLSVLVMFLVSSRFH